MVICCCSELVATLQRGGGGGQTNWRILYDSSSGIKVVRGLGLCCKSTFDLLRVGALRFQDHLEIQSIQTQSL